MKIAAVLSLSYVLILFFNLDPHQHALRPSTQYYERPFLVDGAYSWSRKYCKTFSQVTRGSEEIQGHRRSIRVKRQCVDQPPRVKSTSAAPRTELLLRLFFYHVVNSASSGALLLGRLSAAPPRQRRRAPDPRRIRLL